MKDDGLENYRNREHGYIKHRILETYLLRVFNILGKFEKQINYVDGFAGLWQSQDEQHGDTSTGISIECMAKCIDSVRSTYDRSITFRGLYIEKHASKYGELQSFVDEKARETGLDLTTCTAHLKIRSIESTNGAAMRSPSSLLILWDGHRVCPA